MQADSRPVSSNQRFLHPRLAEVVARHLQRRHLRPVSAHSREAFRALLARQDAAPRPLVLDSFCGTGRSSARLAAAHPDHLVVGIDKSAHRLGRHVAGEADNYLLLQADCEDIWALVETQAWTVAYHYLLYPNPWPKAAHLQRRVHGHPALANLLALGGTLELRSNWQLYVEEFGTALNLAGCRGRITTVKKGSDPLTLFEAKYQRSGHDLWRFRAHCEPRS